jgi:hypothetical protein
MRIIFRIILSLVGILLALMGAVWFLQGINVLPGSLMSGQIQWAIYGVIAVSVGIVLLVSANRWCGFTRVEGCQS